VALRNRELPLEKSEVSVLVLQALFHLGKLQVAQNKCLREWRGEGTDEFLEVLGTLLEELSELADELRDKIREQGSIQLLGQVCFSGL
jgi:hypothetical protein